MQLKVYHKEGLEMLFGKNHDVLRPIRGFLMIRFVFFSRE
jgi:hypothetical protein